MKDECVKLRVQMAEMEARHGTEKAQLQQKVEERADDASRALVRGRRLQETLARSEAEMAELEARHGTEIEQLQDAYNKLDAYNDKLLSQMATLRKQLHRQERRRRRRRRGEDERAGRRGRQRRRGRRRKWTSLFPHQPLGIGVRIHRVDVDVHFPTNS